MRLLNTNSNSYVVIQSLEIDFALILDRANIRGWTQAQVFQAASDTLEEYKKQHYIKKYTLLRTSDTKIETIVYCPGKKLIKCEL